MPTYRNDGTAPITVKSITGSFVMVRPGETVESYHQYTQAGLTRLSEGPYWNPVLDSQTVTFASADETQLVALTDIPATRRVTVWQVQGTGFEVEVYLGDVTNTPYVTKLREGDVLSFVPDQRVSGLSLVSRGAGGSCAVVVALDDIGMELRE